MRWMNSLLERLGDDRGATAVIVAISLTALIGMAAFAIDVGALYAERRELQSGADAGALAIAEACGLGESCTSGAANATASSYASSNATDGVAGVESVDLNTAASKVTVTTKTHTASGSDVYKPFLAQVVGFNGTTVHAKATAIWGHPKSLTTLPLIISDCEWTSPGITDPPTTVNLRFHDADAEKGGDCPVGPAGHDSDGDGLLPGGFGWLGGSIDCSATVEVGDWVARDPGNGPPQACRDMFPGLLNTTVLIPFYDDLCFKTGCPLSVDKSYHIAGFGAFHITGFRFPGLSGGANCGGNSCLSGYFTEASAPEGELGGPNRGVVVVKLTE